MYIRVAQMPDAADFFSALFYLQHFLFHLLYYSLINVIEIRSQ